MLIKIDFKNPWLVNVTNKVKNQILFTYNKTRELFTYNKNIGDTQNFYFFFSM